MTAAPSGALALAIAQARPESRVLVVSTDPAHSLGDRLQVKLTKEPQALSFDFTDVSLDAMEIDPESELATLRNTLGECIETAFAEKLHGSGFSVAHDQEAMMSLLDLTPPGLDELMALLVLADHLNSNRYAHIIVDSAPSGHLLRLLEMPEIIEDWLQAIFVLLLKYAKVFSSLELNRELSSMKRKIKLLRSLLQDPKRCQAVIVTRPTEMCLRECLDLRASLARLQMPLEHLLINQLRYVDTCDACGKIFESEARSIDRYRKEFSDIKVTTIPRMKITGRANGVPASEDDLLQQLLAKVIVSESQAS